MRTMLAAVPIGLLAACALQQPAPPGLATTAPPGFPEAYYRQAAAQGVPVYRIDAARSRVVIEVHRGGSLARLGHAHVVASHDVGGFVAPDAKRADLYVRLDSLVVDEPDLRREAGFDTQPTDEDVAGTRRNMLSSMEAGAFPFALIRVVRPEGRAEQVFDVTVNVHGVERIVKAPVHVEIGTGSVVATGRLALRQTDFGITPLSVLGGAIQVQDEVNVRFAIYAGAVE